MKPAESASTQSGAFCVSGESGEVFIRLGSNRWAASRKSYPKSDRKFLSKLGYQDVRGLLLGAMLGCSRTPEKKLDTATLPSVEELSSNILSAVRSGDEVSVTNLYEDCGYMEGVGLKVTTRYSLDSLMPLTESTSLFHHKSKKTRTIETVIFSWKETDGLMLPTMVTVKKRLDLNVNGRREVGWKTRTHKLTWNLVNSDEQDQRFYDGSLLESDELIQKQLVRQQSTPKNPQTGK